MLKRLESGQKLSENEINLAERAGIKITDGVIEADYREVLEGFAQDTYSKKKNTSRL